jgi:hypothetical protein
MEDLRYPIGKVKMETEVTEAQRQQWINEIAQLPAQLKEAVKGWSTAQLDTPYRPEGWTVRQVIHHLADSHIHCYIRFRFGLTEEEPVVKPYNEVTWAELADAKTGPIELSLSMLEAIHGRWVLLLRTLPASAFSRTIRHLERGLMSMDTILNLYSWHGRHHLAHITSLRNRMEWK